MRQEGLNSRPSSLADKRAGRDGIALVVVLGFLAVLSLMAVGMAVGMRTERLASRSHLDMVNARMFCQAALADSMSLLEEAAYLPVISPTNKVMPDFEQYFLNSGSRTVPIDNDYAHYVLPSIETEVGDGNADTLANSLISGLGTNFLAYIPGRMWRAFIKEGGLGSDILQGTAQWLHVKNRNEEVVGRFMYAVINNTGRPDINYVGREIEPSGMHIKGDWLGCIARDDYQLFMADREEDIRYETFRDLRDGNTSIGSDKPNMAPVDMTVFSYFQPMRRIKAEEDGISQEFVPVYLDPERDTLDASRNDVEDAFRAAIDGAAWRSARVSCDAADLYNLLADYIDENDEPRNPEGPSCEAVPMINEIYLSESNIAVEVWEPYVGSNRFDSSFDVEVAFAGSSAKTTANIAATEAYMPFEIQTVNIKPVNNITNAVNDLVVTVLDGATELDRVDFGKFSNAVEPGRSWQCNDPRFNHHESQWRRQDTESLGDINPVAIAGFRDNGSNPAAKGYITDGDYLMYCANRPLICSGELGYLPVAPWRTLKLYRDRRDPRSGIRNMDPVIDYFTVFGPDKSQYGLINPNEKFDSDGSGNILRAILGFTENGAHDCYTLFPGDDSHDTYYPASDINILQYMVDGEGDDLNLVNPFINTSDVGNQIFHPDQLGSCKDNAASGGVEALGNTELRLEGAMRRFSALGSVRGQVYTVLLWAQALGDGEGEDWDTYPILSEAQAVAMVWRDPYPDANGQHPKFVRFMRWFE